MLRIELPETLSETEARLLLALKAFEVGRVTLGQAARKADLSERGFLEIMGLYHVSVFNSSLDLELRDEFA